MLLFLSLALGCYDPVIPVHPLRIKPKATDVESPPEVVQGITGTIPQPPRIHRVQVEPRAPTAHEDLRVVVEVTDANEDFIDLDYLWIINDQELIHQTNAHLASAAFVKGDVVRVRVSAKDGTHQTRRESKGLTILNSPPFFVQDPRVLASINGSRVEATDPDGDPILYRLVGTPEGMSINPTTGRISYTGSMDERGGAYKARVIAEDPDKASVVFAFDLTVSPGSGAKTTTTGGGTQTEEAPPIE